MLRKPANGPTRVNVEKDISVQGNQNHPGTSVSLLLQPPA